MKMNEFVTRTLEREHLVLSRMCKPVHMCPLYLPAREHVGWTIGSKASRQWLQHVQHWLSRCATGSGEKQPLVLMPFCCDVHSGVPAQTQGSYRDDVGRWVWMPFAWCSACQVGWTRSWRMCAMVQGGHTDLGELWPTGAWRSCEQQWKEQACVLELRSNAGTAPPPQRTGKRGCYWATSLLNNSTIGDREERVSECSNAKRSNTITIANCQLVTTTVSSTPLSTLNRHRMRPKLTAQRGE